MHRYTGLSYILANFVDFDATSFLVTLKKSSVSKTGYKCFKLKFSLLIFKLQFVFYFTHKLLMCFRLRWYQVKQPGLFEKLLF